ncbi:transcriptional regulator, HxlR family [Tistlia consotensis]|uniref:Transcriptional regulator, HxlR family n=1 Tax=Tistlia consotensis USBA 355 TaxID=560819 RepID=A0A1Y6CDV0_9PROT|nr:helix-turn-helix domain-containing protein [Tistlia consotensis]SMF58644.1 transcriptional regulator, HxlR family [Tistlia consotensis USBA 355]SNR63480.1 transcriptional regulator, HxlR family [Tistlia consotensis]
MEAHWTPITPEAARHAPDSAAVRPDKTAPEGFERDSTISDTLQILADPWRFLVIREAFFGAHRFGEFAGQLGIPRATLAKCLARLVESGIFEERPLAAGSSWKRYLLSERGRDLYAIFLGLMWYGDKWLCEGLPPVALFHRPTRRWFSPRIVWEHDLSAVDPRSVFFRIREGYWRPRQARAERSRRMSRSAEPRGRRPSSVERTLSIVGDRWTFLILQEFFHGNKRFEDFSHNLGIASNILADRLNNLVAGGLIERPSEGAGRYLLTRKGLDIYGPMILMKSWGDRWCRSEAEITSQFVARASGTVTRAIVVVPGQTTPISARDVGYMTTYALDDSVSRTTARS